MKQEGLNPQEYMTGKKVKVNAAVFSRVAQYQDLNTDNLSREVQIIGSMPQDNSKFLVTLLDKDDNPIGRKDIAIDPLQDLE